MGGGDKTPAAYDGLKNSRVAIVCLKGGEQSDAEGTATRLARVVESNLVREVKGIELISQDEIADWVDTYGWNQMDYVEFGKGIKADKVLAIELERFTLEDGPTLYKGRSQFLTKVYDIKEQGGRLVWSKERYMFEHPKTAGRYRDSTPKEKFKQEYLRMLGREIAKNFHPFAPVDDVATDAILN
jgi:hypothetical protein